MLCVSYKHICANNTLHLNLCKTFISKISVLSTSGTFFFFYMLCCCVGEVHTVSGEKLHFQLTELIYMKAHTVEGEGRANPLKSLSVRLNRVVVEVITLCLL